MHVHTRAARAYVSGPCTEASSNPSPPPSSRTRRSETLLLLLVQHMLEAWPVIERGSEGAHAVAPPSHVRPDSSKRGPAEVCAGALCALNACSQCVCVLASVPRTHVVCP